MNARYWQFRLSRCYKTDYGEIGLVVLFGVKFVRVIQTCYGEILLVRKDN